MHEPVVAPSRLPAPRARRFAAVRGAASGVALVAASGGVLVVLLDTVRLPAAAARSVIPVAIAVAAGVAAVRWLRRGVRTQLRQGVAAKVAGFGGGLYGAVAAATWVYLEAADLVGDVASAGSLPRFLSGLSPGWLLQQAMESVRFAVQAMLWPWFWLSALGPLTAALIAGAVWALDGAARGFAPRLGAGWRGERGVASAEETP
jgi:hypothetical protein